MAIDITATRASLALDFIRLLCAGILKSDGSANFVEGSETAPEAGQIVLWEDILQDSPADAGAVFCKVETVSFGVYAAIFTLTIRCAKTDTVTAPERLQAACRGIREYITNPTGNDQRLINTAFPSGRFALYFSLPEITETGFDEKQRATAQITVTAAMRGSDIP